MKIETDELSDMAQRAYDANAALLRLEDRLRDMDAPADAREAAETARRKAWGLMRRLVLHGASDPQAAALEQDRRERVALGLRVPPVAEIPLHLLGSPKAQLAARALREAAVTQLEMERERGIRDGLGEALSDYADIAEMECYGPVGLGRE